ncbi:hypothetical protein CEXT_499851 [Caerostris extrusa]|uniref:Uncharacterized protein n=1 Tax=Caerostris extrusa TaxID=172846 RepID=A0AAV4MVC0_CAEEX|nr:hypothetical protein CEXT_499851 [Caerostris extrusa]
MSPISKQKFLSTAATVAELAPRVARKRRRPNLRRAQSSGSCRDVHSGFITLDDRTQQIMERSPRMRPPQGSSTSFIFASLECER